MDLEQNTNESPEKKAKFLGRELTVTVLLVSIIAGAASGFAGGFYVSKNYKEKPVIDQRISVVAEESEIIDVVKQVSPAVVSIIISKNLSSLQNDYGFNPFFFDPFFQLRNNQSTQPEYQQTGAGSGFFVESDGLIMTNKHVVFDNDAKYTVITSDGKSYDAKVVATDPVNDLALVKIDITGAPTLKFADSSKIEIGQRVIAIGNSLGQYSNTVTTGIVSGIGRNVVAGIGGVSEQLEGVIQTDAAINPGNSGGPLMNIFGEVIGVNTAIDQQGQLVGFAIPSNDAVKDIESYRKNATITKPFLGVRYILLNETLMKENNLSVDHGAWVKGDESAVAVVKGSAADKAGIKEGDIILSIDGKEISQNRSMASIVKEYNPGDTIKLEILRKDKNITLDVVLGEK